MKPSQGILNKFPPSVIPIVQSLKLCCVITHLRITYLNDKTCISYEQHQTVFTIYTMKLTKIHETLEEQIREQIAGG
jgi:hypothetical protein